MAIRVHVNAAGGQVPSDAPPLALVERGVRAALEAASISDAEVSLTLLGDGEIQAMNRRYLDTDRPTDVIAFALHDRGDPGEPVLGDVYLGLDQARRQARELNVPLPEELLRLAVHGTLHVLGHEHPSGPKREESEMFRRQEAIVTSVLAARSADRTTSSEDATSPNGRT